MKRFSLGLLAVCLSFAQEKSANALFKVKTVFVARFEGGESAAHMRDMVINCLQATALFQITENEERADAVLRGSAEDLIFTEEHNFSDTIGLHATAGDSNSNSYGGSRSASRGIGGSQNETSHIQDRKHEATVAVRLVNKEGDVLWTATKESTGGKFRGASADAADKVSKQLVHDVQALRNTTAPATAKVRN